MDNLLGDIQLKVIEIESKIVIKLVQYIQRNATPLVHITSLIAELDWYIRFLSSTMFSKYIFFIQKNRMVIKSQDTPWYGSVIQEF